MNEESLFHEALQQPDIAARAAFLDEACSNQPELRVRLEKLLQAHNAPASLFNKAAVEMDTTLEAEVGSSNDSDIGEDSSFAPLSSAAVPGTCIGPYKVLHRIGVGGMGEVWMAEQERPVRRQVALKILRPDMDNRQVIARFEQERQALALMDHVNIARVLDAGTTENGRPFFVMELIHGIPITQYGIPITRYCDDKQLTIRERLELFVPVCQAIQHAHQKGIIHRDIKPSNVLVTLCDGKPVPKVIDFGVAKAIDPKLTERTLFRELTEVGALIGTLEYMSPEQADLDNLDIDTRSDIYSLGVLLYELLTGTLPLDKKRIKEVGVLKTLRLIRDEEPPQPSVRLHHSEMLPAVAAARKMEPIKLAKLVRGELDWIVMKALEKDRTRRYETANGLARNVEHYLADEAVEVAPPSVWYRFRKFAQRKKTALAVAACIVLALAGIAGSVGWALRDRAAQKEEIARQQREQEEKIERQQREREQTLDQSVESTLKEAESLIEQGKSPEGLARVDRAEQLLAAAGRTERPRRLLDLRKDLEMVLRLNEARLTFSTVKDGHFDWEGADRAYAEAFRWYGLDLQQPHPQEAAQRIRGRPISRPLAAALRHWASVRQAAGGKGSEHLQAVAEAADPDDLLRRLHEIWNRGDGKALEELAASTPIERLPPDTLLLLGEAMGAIVSLERKAAFLRQVQPSHLADFWINHELAFSLSQMGGLHLEEAIRYYTVAVALRPQSPGARLNLTQARLSLAKVYYDRGLALAARSPAPSRSQRPLLVDAISEFRLTIELDPKHAPAHYHLGCVLRDKGQVDEAIAEFRAAIRLKNDYAEAHFDLGAILCYLRHDYDGAIRALHEAIRLKKDNATAHYNLGNALWWRKGRLDEAIAEFREAIRLKKDYAEAHCNLGLILMRDKGQFQQAAKELREGHQLGCRNPSWQYRSDQWLRDCERFSALDENLPEMLSGQLQPTDAEECLALAQLCQLPSKRLYFAARHFYAEAFAGDRQLAAANRYNAACSAALAGCGQGNDAGKLNANQRTRLRRQALDWLRQDLKAHLQSLDKSADKADPAIAQQMQLWLDDADFAGVRGPDALARLPETERAEWRKLWEEVEALNQRSAAKPAPAPDKPKPQDGAANASEIGRLIKQLGSDDFTEREVASKRLEDIGEPAWIAVRKAAVASPDLEIRHRARRTADTIGRRCFGEIRRLGSGGDSWLNRVAFTADGQRALASGGAVILFDLETGKEIYRVLEESQSARLDFALSNDGRYFLTGRSNDKVVRLGLVRSGKQVQRFEGHTAGVYAVALSPDASHAVSGGIDETLRLWDVQTGRELRQFRGSSGKIRCLAYSPDGRHILSGHFGEKSNNLIYLWQVETGATVERFQGHSGDVTAVAFVPNSNSFISASMDGTLRVWDLQSGKELRRLDHPGGANDVKVSPDGRRALSAGRGDKSVRLWDLATGIEFHRFVGHTIDVLGVAISPDGRQALSSDAANTLRLWRLPKPDTAPDKTSPQRPVKRSN